MMNYLRWTIFERDSYTCVLCHSQATDLHHLVPRSRGGSNAPQNLVSLCRCHHDLVHGKRWAGTEMTAAEAKQTLLEYLCDCYAE